MKRLYHLIFVAGLVGACGGSSNNNKGGDHVPDDKTYRIASVPEAAKGSGLRSTEYDSQFLRSRVHLSERYTVCLEEASWPNASLLSLRARLRESLDQDSRGGLEGLINYALGEIRKFDSNRESFSSRIEIDVVYVSSLGCDLLVLGMSRSEFPFSSRDFNGKPFALLQAGQLLGDDGSANEIPVGYLSDEFDSDDAEIKVQALIANYLGLNHSSTSASYLNADTLASDSDKSWNVRRGDALLIENSETQTVFAFVLAYADILTPSDLDSFHHYQDQLTSGNPPNDELLTMPSVSTLDFEDTVGNRYLEGVRAMPEDLRVCFVNRSSVSIDEETFDSYLDELSYERSDSLLAYLNERDSSIKTTASRRSVSCHLVVAIRDDSQFPFSDRSVNGLYTEEGSVKDSQGNPTKAPVIYLNATNLETGNSQASSRKHISLVLRHEFAHFAGLKHSPSNSSILSPSGYNTRWDSPGLDNALFDEFVEHFKKHF